MKNFKIIVISFLMFFAHFSYAKNSDVNLNVAEMLLQSGEVKDGYNLLLADFDKNSTNAFEYRLLGLLAKANGKLFSAKEYFNSAIKYSQTPELSGEMQLELAQVEYQLGNGEVAKNYLTKVQAMNPPKKVGDNIDNFLAAINSGNTPKNYSGSISLGFISDSNVNAGPETDSVLMFGLPFTLSSDAKANKDTANTVKLNFNHQKLLSDDWTLQNSFAINSTNYNSLDNLDSTSVSLSSGISTKYQNTVASVPIIIDWVKIGHDASYYSYSYGVAPQLRHSLTKQLTLNANASISRKKFKAEGKSDMHNSSLGMGVQYQLNNQSYTGVNLSSAYSKSDVATETSNSQGITLSYGYHFANASHVSLNLAHNTSKYQGVEVAYNKTRSDKTTSANLSYTYPLWDYALTATASYTHNDSNIEMYEYKRTQLSATLAYRF